MLKMRLHLYIAMGVFLVMFIVGSFLDLQIAQGIFSENNGFGLTVAALSMNLGYAVIAAMGGIVLYHGVKLAKLTWQKVIFIVGSFFFLGAAIYFDAKEFFGPNGWTGVAPEYMGYIIAAPLMGGAMYLGYLVGKKANNPQLWILMVVGAFFIGLSLIIGTTVVKNIFHRPRYRIAVADGCCDFYPWWERCHDYKSIMNFFGIGKEEFKSFPSGHTSVCALTMFGVILYPFVTGKELKNQVLYFYIGMAYTLFVAFTRMLVGAHYLSDVGMGGLISLVCTYIFYEIILHKPIIYKKEESEETIQQAE